MESWSPVTHPVKQQTAMLSWLSLLGAPDSGSPDTRTQLLDVSDSRFQQRQLLAGMVSAALGYGVKN